MIRPLLGLIAIPSISLIVIAPKAPSAEPTSPIGVNAPVKWLTVPKLDPSAVYIVCPSKLKDMVSNSTEFDSSPIFECDARVDSQENNELKLGVEITRHSGTVAFKHVRLNSNPFLTPEPSDVNLIVKTFPVV